MNKSKFLFLLLSLPSLGLAKPENAALAAIKALFPSLGKSSQIKTQGCKFDKAKWATTLLTKEGFTEKISFNKTCDLQGSYTVAMDKFFPVKLSIRNLKGFESIESKVKFSVIFEDKAVLKTEMSDAILKGEKNIYFKMDYGVFLDLMNENPIGKHKGGTLYLEKHGKNVLNKRIPLKF